MKKIYRTEKKGRMFLSAAAFIITMIAIALLNILRLYVSDKFPQYIPEIPTTTLPEKVIICVMIAVAALYVFFILIMLPLWYRTIKYVINEKELISYSGIFSRTYRIMKLSSIQNVAKISLPLSRITAFNFIKVNALGGTVVMMFLSDSDCAELMDMFTALCKNPPAGSRGRRSRYTVEKPLEGGADYIYRDSSGIADNSDILNAFEEYPQLSFDDDAIGDQLEFKSENRDLNL